MLKNYVKTAVRSLIRQKLYSAINLLSLAVGLACFILTLLFTQHELSYDRFHKHSDLIYRVVQRRPIPGGFRDWGVTSPAMARTLTGEFPEVTLATAVAQTSNPLLTIGDQQFQDQGIFADPRFFDVFTFPLLRGNAKTAIADPGGIVLTERLARKIFGHEDPMGKTLIYENREAHVVTGIVADPPENSHLAFDYILPAQCDTDYRFGLDKEFWNNNGWYTYVVLAKSADAAPLEEKLRALTAQVLSGWRPGERMAFRLQPLVDIHLHSQNLMTFDFERKGDIDDVYLFLALGFAILLVACINYTNLAMARSMKRVREVGIRKAVGARVGQLFAQFLGESVLTASLALVLALLIVGILLPVFSHLVERAIRLDFSANALVIPELLGLVLLVGALSGGYPAFFLVSLRPIQLLKGRHVGSPGRFRLQHVLIVGQFAAAIALVIGSSVVREQMQFVHHLKVGYNREHILTVQADDPALSRNFASIRAELLRNPRILAVSYSKFLPTNIRTTQAIVGWDGSGEGQRLPTMTSGVDYYYLDVFGIPIVAGRGFTPAFGSDTLGSPIALINETAARALHWSPEEAIGKRFYYTDGRGRRTIVGVMKDFHYNSLHSSIEPLVLTLIDDPQGYISARVRPEDMPGTIAQLERTVKRFSTYPFSYQFMDEHFDQLYKSDIKLGEMFGAFTLLALSIASLGLFGLAAYASERRTKEIGIRQVLGASASGIIGLLTKDFARLVLMANLIAWPVAWYAMNQWLQSFASRIEMQWWLFAFAGAVALIIAMSAVCYQAVRGARANPVDALRYE